jgi:hypothetical protein
MAMNHYLLRNGPKNSFQVDKLGFVNLGFGLYLKLDLGI